MKRMTRRSGLLAGLLFPFARQSRAADQPLLANRAAARAIGAAYLRAYPGDTLADARAAAGLPRAQIALRVRADFAAGRVVMLDGWMLSATEVRLCALALRGA
jgi:hypothetical protein